MNKKEIIAEINSKLQAAGVEHGLLKYHNRTKATFEMLLKRTDELVDIKRVYDGLEEEFTPIELVMAAVDGSEDPAMQRILEYRHQIGTIIDELDLG